MTPCEQKLSGGALHHKLTVYESRNPKEAGVRRGEAYTKVRHLQYSLILNTGFLRKAVSLLVEFKASRADMRD